VNLKLAKGLLGIAVVVIGFAAGSASAQDAKDAQEKFDYEKTKAKYSVREYANQKLPEAGFN